MEILDLNLADPSQLLQAEDDTFPDPLANFSILSLLNGLSGISQPAISYNLNIQLTQTW